MGKFDFYVPKEENLIEEYLRKLPNGERSTFIVGCLKGNLKQVIDDEIMRHKQKIEELEALRQEMASIEHEQEANRIKNSEWFENLVKTFASDSTRELKHVSNWAHSPQPEADLKKHGYTTTEFVKAVEERRRRA